MSNRFSVLRVGATILSIGVLLPSLVHGGQNATPLSVRVISGPEPDAEAGEDEAGNVMVTLSNGRKEMWTAKGWCVYPKISKSGLVGWTHGLGMHPTQGLRNGELVIARHRHVFRRIAARQGFIDDWFFTDGDHCVVIRSRGPHGPAWLEKVKIHSGEVIDGCSARADENMPTWAKPFSE